LHTFNPGERRRDLSLSKSSVFGSYDNGDLGEWHSHPSFALHPSSTDNATTFDIVHDSATGARFAVSIIVKLVADRPKAEAFIYFPGRLRESGRTRV
jgi:hypothetical protein